jgi:hypothetical protein
VGRRAHVYLGARPNAIRRLLGLTALSFALMAGAVACSPSLYTFNLVAASSAVEQARQANAPEHAPYEYFTAQSYLDKAREEAAQANNQDAMRFADRAIEYGNKAVDISRRRMRELGR